MLYRGTQFGLWWTEIINGNKPVLLERRICRCCWWFCWYFESNFECYKAKRQRSICTITGLAEHCKIATTNAHNPLHDCIILQKILKKCKISYSVDHMEISANQSEYWDFAVMKDLTLVSRRKLVASGITLYVLKNTYLQSGEKRVK